MVQSCIVEAVAAAAREAGTCQAERPNLKAAHTQCRQSTKTVPQIHMATLPLPVFYLCAAPFPLSLTFYRCTADIIWTIFLCASLLVGLSVSRVFRLGLINWVNGAYENLEFAMSR